MRCHSSDSPASSWESTHAVSAGSGSRRDIDPTNRPNEMTDLVHRPVHRPNARGCADSYTSNSRSWLTLVYTWVVEIDAWPSISCTMRRSAP